MTPIPQEYDPRSRSLSRAARRHNARFSARPGTTSRARRRKACRRRRTRRPRPSDCRPHARRVRERLRRSQRIEPLRRRHRLLHERRSRHRRQLVSTRPDARPERRDCLPEPRRDPRRRGTYRKSGRVSRARLSHPARIRRTGAWPGCAGCWCCARRAPRATCRSTRCLPGAINCRIKYAIDYAADAEDTQLPPFDLVFNAIGEPDVAAPLAGRLARFMSHLASLRQAPAAQSACSDRADGTGPDPPVARRSARRASRAVHPYR